MSYKSNTDLPQGVTNVLPEHAQDIYRKAYNSAYDEYKKASDRHGDDDRETVAHKVAWAAVKKKYEKDHDGRWHTKK